MSYFAWIICAIDILLAFVIVVFCSCYIVAGFTAPSLVMDSSNYYFFLFADVFYGTVFTIPLVMLVSGILAPLLHKKNPMLALVGLVPFFEIGLIVLLMFCLVNWPKTA